MRQQRSVSVAVPVHNEEAVLPELLRRLDAVLTGIPGGPHEIVFVDDGSHDRSVQILQHAAMHDARIRVVVLSRNFGHQPALAAALDHVRGDIVVVMDADLQDAPEDIINLLAPLQEGFDVAYATRIRRKEPLPLRIAYATAYRIIAGLSKTRLPLDAGDFCAMTRRVVDQLKRTPEHNRYLRGLRSWVGFRQTSVPVERSTRFAGESKYSLRSLIRLALDGVFAFSTIPLRIATLAGMIALCMSAVFALYAVYVRIVLSQSPPGFTAIVVLMSFLSGMQLIFLGIIGEYVGRIWEEVQARPLYVVDRVIEAIDEPTPEVLTYGR